MDSAHVTHFIGISEPQTLSAALFLRAKGFRVSGSDDQFTSTALELLSSAGIATYDMFAQTNIGRNIVRVVLSPYYDDRHTEAATAAKAGIPIVTLTDFMKELSAPYRRGIVLGNYEGPMVAQWWRYVWQQGYLAADVLSDALLYEWKEASAPQEPDWFILSLHGFKRDATTYEPNLLSFDAEHITIPSFVYDYPELYTTLDDVYQSYYALVKKVPRKGLVVGNGDYPRMKRLKAHLVDRHIETYGFDRDNDWQIRDVSHEDTKTVFSLLRQRELYGPFEVPHPGKCALYAAVAVAVSSLLCDMRPETLGKGLATLPKLRRYLEIEIDREDRLIIDDKADHPETIRTVLETIRELYPDKKIWCLYEPGSYLRTKAFYNDIIQSLHLADFVYLTDIHGYPKEKSEGLNVRQLVADLKRIHTQTYYFDKTTDMSGLLDNRVARNDCIVTLGIEGLCQEITRPLIATT